MTESRLQIVQQVGPSPHVPVPAVPGTPCHLAQPTATMTSITRPNEFKRAVAAHGRRANHEPTWVPTAAVGLGLLAALLLAAQAGAQTILGGDF